MTSPERLDTLKQLTAIYTVTSHTVAALEGRRTSLLDFGDLDPSLRTGTAKTILQNWLTKGGFPLLRQTYQRDLGPDYAGKVLDEVTLDTELSIRSSDYGDHGETQHLTVDVSILNNWAMAKLRGLRVSDLRL